MAKTKDAADDGKSQRQKFIDAAREHGADGDETSFFNVVRKVATAPVPKGKGTAAKSKR